MSVVIGHIVERNRDGSPARINWLAPEDVVFARPTGSLNVCPPCAQALHDLCTRALAPCECPKHEGEA